MINQDDEEDTSNSVGATRYPCMPSLVAMQQMRNRLNLAYLGKKLMKWSAMATGRELRRISHEIHGVYDDYSDDSRNGYIVLARARYFYPNLNSVVIENKSKVAQVTLTKSIKTVSGVRVTQYAIVDTEKDAYEYLGIEKGGQLIKEAKTVWNHLVKRMIMILELRTSFLLVEQANRSATKRFNVLGKLIIPKILFTLKYILSELEEKEREENFRLKRFKQLKIKRRDEEVQICRCCFSSFAAGEIMDGDMCTLCKKNVRVKGKLERRVPNVQCIKDGRLQLERACHLDSEKINLPYTQDKLTTLPLSDAFSVTDEKKVEVQIGYEEKEIISLSEALLVNYEEYIKVQNKDEEHPDVSDDFHDKDLDQHFPFVCCETQKTHMYSYILSVLDSVYDEKTEFVPHKRSIHLNKSLRMPANLPYPYEGVDYIPRLLRMPKDIIPSYIETCEKCALQSQACTTNIKMPPDLGSYSIPCVECKSLLNTNTYKNPCEMKNCEKCMPMIHMPLDLPILSCPNCSSKSHLTMPLDVPIHISPCQSFSKYCKNVSPVTSFSSKPELYFSYLPYAMPRETLVCHSWTPNMRKIQRMPRNLSPSSEQDELTIEPPNCFCQPNMHSFHPENEALRKYIHRLCRAQHREDFIRMPLNLAITMPFDIPIHISPCQSLYKNYKKISPVTSLLSKPAPHSSYLSYAAPRETLVCHSWTPNIKKLLRMPRNLSSGSGQSELMNAPPTMSRCACPPNAHLLCPENEALHLYIHRLCEPQCMEDFIHMPLNLTNENQSWPHNGTVYITKESSSCSPCIITSSDEEKLFHDCKIDVDLSCASTCSLCFKNSDYEKIVKVETKKKRRPDGKFREEKVVTEKYVVKTLIKPPDICSCSQSDEFEDVVLGIWSCDHHKNEEDKTENTTYRTDKCNGKKRDTPLETEPKPCSLCISNKSVGKKDDAKGTDHIKPQIVCRCNEEKSSEAQMKCECYNVATSENDDNDNICTLNRLPDLVCCKNNGCLTQKLLKLLKPCQLANQKVPPEYNATNPCHSIIIKSADNETIVCTKSNSKERSCLDTSTPRKEVDILQPGCRFFKSKDPTKGVTCTSPISPLDQKLMASLSMKWNGESSSAKASAQLNQESTISKIVKSYLDKNNHKSTSCTDLEIIRECIKKSEELKRLHVSPNVCDKNKHCSMKNCLFHSHGIAAGSSKLERISLDNESQKSYGEKLEPLLPVTPRNTEMNMAKTNASQKVELKEEYLKMKEEVDKVIKLTSTKDTQSYYKTLGKAESTKSCCPIPSRLGMPVPSTTIISIPKSPLALKVYPSKYKNSVLTKDMGTQMKVPICDREVNPCDTCSKMSSLSCHSTKSKNGHNHDLHNYIDEKSCTVCSQKSASLSSHSSRHKIDNKHNVNHHHKHHHDHHQDHHDNHHGHHNTHHHDDHTKEKCILKIKVKESVKALAENKDFYIEGEMEDGSNVVIMRRSKSNISKYTTPDEIQEGICKNCLAILRGDKPSRKPNCNKRNQQTQKCKYCDLLADYSVSGDPSVNISSVGSGNHCCQTSTLSGKSSFISSVSMPGEELCIKFSSSPRQSNKTRFSPCSITPNRAELKTCEQASRIRGYASDCTIHKPLKSCGTPTPRPCKSVCIVCPRTSDACTSTKVVNRYDVRSICDEPRSRRRTRCTPKASTARCPSTVLQHPMKSDTALNRRKRRTRPVRTRSFYESDCKYFKPPCCGCPF